MHPEKLWKYFKLDYFNDSPSRSDFKNNFHETAKFISHRSHQSLKLNLLRSEMLSFLSFTFPPSISRLVSSLSLTLASKSFSLLLLLCSPPNNAKLQLSFNLFCHRRVLSSICPFIAKRNHRGVQKLLNAIPNWTFNKCPIMCWVECLANVLMAQIKFSYRSFLFVFDSLDSE